MKKILGLTLGLGLFLAVSGVVKANGFDEFGYNDTARNFVGTCKSWHMGKFLSTEAQAEAYCGVYSDDMLKMSWNEEWDRGNLEGWSDPNGYEGAWTDNVWNGRKKGGSGENWHYRIKWVGSCGADYTPLPSGGYCLWGQFEVLMDHGSNADHEHVWLGHSIPAGYGSYQE